MAQPEVSRDRILYQVAAELTSSLDLDEVLSRVMDRVIELMHATRGFIVLVNPETNRMEVRMARGADEEDLKKEFLGSKTVIDQVMAEGKSLLTTDASLDDRFKGQQSVILHNLRSIIAAPLLVRGRTIGAVYVDNPFRAGIFEEADKDFLQAISDLAAIAIDNALTYQHAEFLRSIFERYVNKTVIEYVLADPNRDQVWIPGQRLRVTMLNSDIAGFSQLSREMEAEELVEFLNHYFSRMVDVVLEHGGNVDKFQGDGLLVAFGAPVPMEDSAVRAVNAARDMLRVVDEINSERARLGDAPIDVGIGLDTGYVVAGNVGSLRRLEYTLIGVPVNNAAYLSKIRPPAVVMSQSTYKALDGQIQAEARTPIVLKGGFREVPVFALERG